MGPLKTEAVEATEVKSGQELGCSGEVPAATESKKSTRASAVSKVQNLLQGSLPVEAFVTCDIPFNWLFRPEMILGPVLYNVSINLCAWTYVTCPVDWAVGGGYVFVIAIGKMGMHGLILNASGVVLAAIVTLETVMAVLTLYMMDTSLFGTVGSLTLEAVCVVAATMMGKLEPRRCRYFVVANIWILLTQLAPVMVLRFNWLLEILPAMLESMALPVISVFYSAVAVRSLRMMNRMMLSAGMPVRALTGIMYPILAIAQCLVVVGFMPRVAELLDPTLSQLLLRFGGASISTIGSELASRFFVPQRLKHKMETLLGLKPGPLTIQPEMDSYMRSCFALDHVAVFWAILFLLLAMPGGAWWAFAPLVWLGLLVRWLAAMLCDFIVVLVHRHYYPIKGESFFQTVLRLQQCFQHWPDLQCDSGRGFSAAKAAVEGGEPRESTQLHLTPEVLELMQAKWSSHSYFTDARMIAVSTTWVPMLLLVAGFVAIYGKCGLWEHLELDICQ